VIRSVITFDSPTPAAGAATTAESTGA
jgi:hypothetical protein